ncbi:heterokaryon incompatibility protein-domain-containing protein [Staphylotrichum tortipilum]|uniref:Heterokaryon incompatibility protein-domain-containing protein n=1 Tax=Staphylotrichum tortipilum TaxID=2831512 RepID=A0AAN6RSB4_9PEZI|nr:heterokaryon incompatibility protein-domain-containing protein [Staphylotrichum longicolle]
MTAPPETPPTPKPPPFPYTPISPSEFRLLKITATTPHLRLDLQPFSIHSCPPYSALSYEWGTIPPSPSDPTLCNGARFPLSPTLAAALRAVHRHAPAIWLWVDAICINQSDNAEKAYQVTGMAELYSYAEQVLVWLGEAGGESDLVCDLLPGLTDRIWALQGEDGQGWRPMGTEEIVASGLPPAEDVLWRAALALYGRGWFQRMWIVQEIVLAPSCVFLCGRRKLAWSVMMNFAVAVTRWQGLRSIAGLHVKALGEELVNRSTNGIRLMTDTQRLQEGLEEPDRALDGLRMALHVMQSQTAGVKVDYVYAILGMLSEELEIKVVVDYSEDTKRNYGMVHAAFFRQCLGRLRDWPSHLFPPKTARDGNVPSWCPPWGTGWNSRALPTGGYRTGRPSAMSLLPSFNSPSPATAKEDGILRIPGIAVDVIQAVISLDQTDTGNLAEIMKVLKTCAAHMSDGVDGPGRLLGALIGECGWLSTSFYSSTAPDGHLLDGLLGFLEPIVAHEHEHQDEAAYVPMDLDTADYFLGEHRFWRSYLNQLLIRWAARSVAVTEHGRVGLVSRDTRPGDTVCAFLGATLPQVISRHEDGVNWTYVGPTAFDGLVNGETFATDDWMDKKEIFSLR